MTTYLPKLTKGNPDNLGLSIQGNLTNFTLFSHHAEKVILGLFWEGHTQEFPLYRTGDIWHGALTNIPKNATYAYRCIGPKKLFPHPEKWLADPYAKVLKDLTHTYATLPPPFDWQGVQAPKIADKDLIIYEIHIRGFTKHHSSKVSSPGTYLGFIEKIPHLKRLGINAVEFLPIHEFDETYKHPKPLINYWGYNSTHFFAPKKLYAHLDPVNEFKTLVRELHRNGILVILDVVYNHTGEGKEKDYFVNFRGIDDSTYYLLEADGSYSD
jgi:isoamylase